MIKSDIITKIQKSVEHNDDFDFRKLPKIELHAHLNGSISLETIGHLLEKNENVRNKIPADFILQQPTTMEEVFQLFPLIQQLTSTPENLAFATKEVLREFYEDGVVCIELRTTPKNTKFMDKRKYIDTVIGAMKSFNKLTSALILSIDRRQTVEEAYETVELAANDTSELICGVELSGNPSIDGRKFIPVLQRAREYGLPVAVHLAEIEENDAEITEFLKFGPDRIGHGTFLHKKLEYVEIMKKKMFPLEICLTSNVLCKTTETIADSHFSFWKSSGIPIVLCTDDKGLMNDCALSSEFKKAAEAFNLSKDDLEDLCNDALNCSFIFSKPNFKARQNGNFFGKVI